ncbi:MAG: lipid-A-disaccharide synthase, partial [Rhodospirillaceae bacterium]|nr:lipid-A-disaccharide synthase [Rhodospirillaceae bacterium]
MPNASHDPVRSGAGRPLVYFIVGEPSGDQIGGHLIHALKRQTGDGVDFGGIGGPAMAEAGLDSLFSIDLFSVMGLDYLPRLRTILARMKQLERDVARRRPDCVITIDAQALSGHMGRRLARRGETLVQYVAPTVWAWRPGRAKVVAGRLTHLLSIFPFEAPWFEP